MGLIDAFARGRARIAGNGRIDRICRELGWPIDERSGDAVGLYFNGDAVTKRRLVIVVDDGGMIMSFSCNCRAAFTGRTLPDDLLPAVLAHNHDVALAAWHAHIDDGELKLCLRYTALAAAVDAAIFKTICSVLVKEVAEIEANLHAKGLL